MFELPMPNVNNTINYYYTGTAVQDTHPYHWCYFTFQELNLNDIVTYYIPLENEKQHQSVKPKQAPSLRRIDRPKTEEIDKEN